MTDMAELGALFGGLRASVTVADEEFRIIFMNDMAIEHYGYGGGEALIGTDLLDCHNADSQAMLREMYARYRAGDLIPTRYHTDKGDDIGKSSVFIPLIVQGQFRGVVELIWNERSELVFKE